MIPNGPLGVDNGPSGTEYYLNINAYRFDNDQTPIIQAALKLIKLGDPTWLDIMANHFSIEMISYKYSDVYIILDEIWDEED